MNVVGSIDPFVGLAHMLAHPFMRYAFIAGTAIAVATGLVGHFVVLRGQSFSGDALSHVAFTGSFAALAAGADLRFGLFGACVVVALAMGLLGRAGRADDVVIGSLFAWVLGVGVLLLSIYSTTRSGGNGGATTGTSVLFGSVYGLSPTSTAIAVAIAIGVSATVLGIARPLLFSSVDDTVAAAHRVPVTSLGLVFLVLVGVVAGEATQIVGALLLLGLLTTPSAAASRLFADPMRAMGWSVVFTVGSVWSGLTISYLWSTLPPSFSIIAIATSIRLTATALDHRSRRGSNRSGDPVEDRTVRDAHYLSIAGSTESTTDDVDIVGFD